MSAAQPEIGQLIFGGAVVLPKQTPGYITAGFEIIAVAIQEWRGLDADKEWPLTDNGGAAPWEGEVFSMRTYCWCDGSREGHEEECPPNFEHHGSGFSASWYKHSERGQSCTEPIPSAAEWSQIVAECIAEVTR